MVEEVDPGSTSMMQHDPLPFPCYYSPPTCTSKVVGRDPRKPIVVAKAFPLSGIFNRLGTA